MRRRHRAIQDTWEEIEAGNLRGEFGKGMLLQTIYTAYCGWKLEDEERIKVGLGELVGIENAFEFDVLKLLIWAALPHIGPQSVEQWVAAIDTESPRTYGPV